jgi:8-amino-7-oxononanoate synthase
VFDGDSPDLTDLLAVASRHDAILMIDEAHATGVLGADGRGLAVPFEGRDNIITLHTCGKALGTSGGFVLAPKIVRDFLVNRARLFIFATAPSPLIAAVTRTIFGSKSNCIRNRFIRASPDG